MLILVRPRAGDEHPPLIPAPQDLFLIRHVRGMRSCWLREGRPAGRPARLTVAVRWGPVLPARCGTRMARPCLPGCWRTPGRGPRPGSRRPEDRRGAMRAGASTLDVGWGGRGCAAAGKAALGVGEVPTNPLDLIWAPGWLAALRYTVPRSTFAWLCQRPRSWRYSNCCGCIEIGGPD
jgi:hypothetical protein